MLAPYHRHGWEGGDRGPLPCMSHSLRQGEDCQNGCHVWEVRQKLSAAMLSFTLLMLLFVSINLCFSSTDYQNLGLPFYRVKHTNINPFSFYFSSVNITHVWKVSCNSKFQLTFIYWNRTVAEKNAEKKHRTQKVKPKAATAASTSTVEAKKHLAGVRVIQRNLVYIIGLPAYLCNESVSTVSLFTTRYIQVMRHV